MQGDREAEEEKAELRAVYLQRLRVRRQLQGPLQVSVEEEPREDGEDEDEVLGTRNIRYFSVNIKARLPPLS